MTEIFDLIIIGGGPAGVAAGVYAARKKIKSMLITENFKGQSAVSGEIQNWIGDIGVSGDELHKRFEKHLKHYKKDIEIKEGETVLNITKKNKVFFVRTNKAEYETKTIMITTGSVRRKLPVKGAGEFENKGISYCATCDGPMFGDMDVAVIGGGNSAFETASQLAVYAKSVTIIQRSDFRAEPIMMHQTLANPKIKGITNVDLLEIKGDKFVKAIIYKDKKTNKTIELPVQGIFVEIGSNPSVKFIEEGIAKLNEKEEIIVDPRTQRTETLGIWSAGDCTDGLYKQNGIAVGDAIKAIENIFGYLKK